MKLIGLFKGNMFNNLTFKFFIKYFFELNEMWKNCANDVYDQNGWLPNNVLRFLHAIELYIIQYILLRLHNSCQW